MLQESIRTVNELGSLLQEVLWHIEEFRDLVLCCVG